MSCWGKDCILVEVKVPLLPLSLALSVTQQAKRQEAASPGSVTSTTVLEG